MKYFQGLKIELTKHPREVFYLLVQNGIQHIELVPLNGRYQLKQRGVTLCMMSDYQIEFEVGQFNELFRITIDNLLGMNTNMILDKNWNMRRIE